MTRLACFTCMHFTALCQSRGSCKMLSCRTMRLHKSFMHGNLYVLCSLLSVLYEPVWEHADASPP